MTVNELSKKLERSIELDGTSKCYCIEQFAKAASVMAMDVSMVFDNDPEDESFITTDIFENDESSLIETFLYSLRILSKYGDPESIVSKYMDYVGWN